MPILTADKPHALMIPGELYSQIARVAEAEGQDPDQLTLAALAATFKFAGADEWEPAWKTRLRAAQERAQQAFEESGLTEEEIGADIDAEVKTYRAERHAQWVQP
ncbi:MAG: hypothetical protein H7Y38_07725 [Armatimonadetes bacterium]|nr:hypothetical protein [Armatimonadota bacterium]